MSEQFVFDTREWCRVAKACSKRGISLQNHDHGTIHLLVGNQVTEDSSEGEVDGGEQNLGEDDEDSTRE